MSKSSISEEGSTYIFEVKEEIIEKFIEDICRLKEERLEEMEENGEPETARQAEETKFESRRIEGIRRLKEINWESQLNLSGDELDS